MQPVKQKEKDLTAHQTREIERLNKIIIRQHREIQKLEEDKRHLKDECAYLASSAACQ